MEYGRAALRRRAWVLRRAGRRRPGDGLRSHELEHPPRDRTVAGLGVHDREPGQGGDGVAAAISQWRFRNIDHRLVLQLAIPGALGAVAGVTVLSNVDGDTVRPLLAVLLLVMGARILWRFSRPPRGGGRSRRPRARPGPDAPFDDGVGVVAATGGVTNGLIGAWGPVVTPFLMHRGLAPRFAVGSVNTAEVAVATVSATSLVASLGRGSTSRSWRRCSAGASGRAGGGVVRPHVSSARWGSAWPRCCCSPTPGSWRRGPTSAPPAGSPTLLSRRW